METDLKAHYIKVLKIRNEAAANLIASKGDYITKGGNDQFILALYDQEINFMLNSIRGLDVTINKSKGNDVC